MTVSPLPMHEVCETWVPSQGQEDALQEAWQPTPVFLPGESHGQRGLAGYSSWGLKESVLKQLSTYTHAHTHMYMCVYTQTCN